MLSYNDFAIERTNELASAAIVEELDPYIALFSEDKKVRIEKWLANIMKEAGFYVCLGDSVCLINNSNLQVKISEYYNAEEDFDFDCKKEDALKSLGIVAYFLYLSANPLLDDRDQKRLMNITLPRRILSCEIDFETVNKWIRHVVVKAHKDLPIIKKENLKELYNSEEDELLCLLAWSSFRYVFDGHYNYRYFRKYFIELINEEILSRKIEIRSCQLKDAVDVALAHINCYYTNGRKEENIHERRKNLKAYIKEIVNIHTRYSDIIYPMIERDINLIEAIYPQNMGYLIREFLSVLRLLKFVEEEYQNNLQNAKLYKFVKEEKPKKEHKNAPVTPSPTSDELFDKMVKYVMKRIRSEEVSTIVALMQNLYRKDGAKMEIIENLELNWQAAHNPQMQTNLNFNAPVGQAVAHADWVEAKK